MKKTLIAAIVGVVIVCFALGMVKDALIMGAAKQVVRGMTGLKLHMDGFRVGIITQVVDIKGLRLSNPANFKEPVMANIPEIYMSLDIWALLKNQAHIKEMRLDLKEFVVEKNERGELNLNSLNVVKSDASARPSPAAQKSAAPAKKEGKEIAFKIDKLKLKIGKVIYKDYSSGTLQTREFNINIDETYSDIEDPMVLASLIITKALMNTTIASLSSFDLTSIRGALPADLSGQMAAVQKTVDRASKALTQALGASSGTASTQEAVKKSAEAIKNVLGGLSFGGGTEEKQ